MSNPIKQAFDKQFADIRMDEGRLERLQNSTSTKTPRPAPFKKALVLALALIVVVGVGYSASQYLGAVDWQGNKTPEETKQAPTDSPDVSQHMVHEALQRMPPEELWLAHTDAGIWTTFFPKIRVNSYEEVKELLARSDSPLMLPDNVTAAYTFDYGILSHYIDTRYYESLQRLADETPAPGLTLRGYRLSQEALEDFRYYSLYFVNKKGDQLRLDARLSGGQEDFGLWQGEKVKPIVIPGFDNALLFERNGAIQVFFQQAGIAPISACRMDYFTIAPDTDDYPLEPEIFTSVTYSIHYKTASGESVSSAFLETLAKSYTQP